MEIDFNNPNIFDMLLNIGKQYGFDPQVPIESETYFRKLLTEYPGNEDMSTLESWLHKRVQSDFVALEERPLWIQGPNWPFDNNLQPMIFIGQIDVKVEQESKAAHYLHDDTTYYVFMAQDPDPFRIIVQQF